MARFSIWPISFAVIAAAALASCSPQLNLSNDAADGDLAAVHRDLANKLDPNTKLTGEPVLLFAASNGHLDVVKALLQAGADVNAKEDQSGETALMAAAGGGHTDLIGPLVAAGAGLEARNEMGQTALIEAITLNHPDTVQALIDAGADVNEEFTKPDGPTILAIFKDEPKLTVVTQMLIKNGAHI